MIQYHKINTIWKRGVDGRIIQGEFSTPELEYLAECTWVFTEKVDGTNVRVMWDGSSLRFGGKTDNAQMPVFLIDRLNELFSCDKMCEVFSDTTDVCLYGEGFGNRIQKCGHLYRKDSCDFVLFDVKVGDLWLTREDVFDVASRIGIDVVPAIARGRLLDACDIVSKGIESLMSHSLMIAEGLVARPEVEMRDRLGRRVIAKIKTRDFAE